MSTRVVSFLLALTLLWSAFMTVGAGAQAAGSKAPVSVIASVELAEAGSPEGSLADHHLDEQPAQGLLEAAVDPVALFTSHPQTQAPPLTMARPTAPGLAAWPAPHLDGPQRPPRPTALVG